MFIENQKCYYHRNTLPLDTARSGYSLQTLFDHKNRTVLSQDTFNSRPLSMTDNKNSNKKTLSTIVPLLMAVLAGADLFFNKGKCIINIKNKLTNVFSPKNKTLNSKTDLSHNQVFNSKTKLSRDTSGTILSKNIEVKNFLGKIPKTIEYDKNGNLIRTFENTTLKGKLISIEKIISDKEGKIIKYIIDEPKRGTNAVYDYVNAKYSINGARYQIEDRGVNIQKIKSVDYNVEKINPQNIFFTQKSMGENYKDIVQSFKKYGWVGKPVDVIKTKNGEYISIDNRRIAAAREAGIDVHAVVHNLDEPLTRGKQVQYQVQSPSLKEQVVIYPKTWGEAVYNRLFQNGLILNNGKIDLITAHNIPSTVEDVLLDSRKDRLYELYVKNQAPYFSNYF